VARRTAAASQYTCGNDSARIWSEPSGASPRAWGDSQVRRNRTFGTRHPVVSPLAVSERRSAPRVEPEATPWRALARLRPGLEVVVINISAGGALIQSARRIHPGARAELQLLGSLGQVVSGRVQRCRVNGLDPLRYEGAIIFDVRLHWNAASGSEFPEPSEAVATQGKTLPKSGSRGA
jgi:hypothetical protein